MSSSAITQEMIIGQTAADMDAMVTFVLSLRFFIRSLMPIATKRFY